MSYSSTVADLTVDELKNLIKDVVAQTILEIFNDPDKGLELRDEIRERLHNSLPSTQSGSQTSSAKDVAVRLGLKW